MLFPSLVGFYCTSGVNVSAPDQHFTGLGGQCPVGHECQEGSSTFHPCDPGYYAAVEGMSTCDTCPAGLEIIITKSNVILLTLLHITTKQHLLSLSFWFFFIITYCCKGLDFRSILIFLEFSGKYCNGTTVTPASCPAGHFCPNGTEFATQYPCKPGSYNNVTDQASESSCKLCDPGKYCEGSARVWPNDLCDEGFFCSGGSWSKRPGDIGVASYSNATSPADSCYTAFECVCPAWNKTTGKLKLKLYTDVI